MPTSRPKKNTPDREAIETAETSQPPSQPLQVKNTPAPPAEPGGRNRAVVDSDSENDKSDTSIESDEESLPTKRKKKSHPLPQRKQQTTKK